MDEQFTQAFAKSIGYLNRIVGYCEKIADTDETETVLAMLRLLENQLASLLIEINKPSV